MCAIGGSWSNEVAAQTGNDTGDAEPPLVTWHFDGKAEPALPKKHALEPGPRPPSYPSFTAANNAFAFSKPHDPFTFREADLPKANLRFNNGDSITLEAWVKVQELKDGNYAYLIGKGRTRAAGFPEKNQNYALRLFGSKGESCISFLFASQPTKDTPADWHRWTSTKGFTSGGWHHVAVCYTFGKPASIRGYVDGEKVAGKWDMGGATERPPVADADDLQLGTGNGAGAGNTFKGWMDDVAIWRTALADATLTGRYQFIPPPPVVKRTDLPHKQVLVQVCEEGLPNRNAWPESPPKATDSYHEDAFGFFEVPHKYVDTGVRGDRANPFLLRAAAIVPIPAGKHRLLLRGRGATRLYFDDKLVLTTPFPPTDSSGHGHVAEQKNYLDLGPDFRFVPPGNRETWTTFETKGGEHLVVMETIVGGYIGNGRRRPELGETVVAISPEGTESWQLLSPNRKVPYTDEGWAAYEADRTANLERMNAQARAMMRAKHNEYWERRREIAKKWLNESVDVKVPALTDGFPANNKVDHFIADKIAHVRAQSAAAAKGTVDYFKHVQPILESKCLECHSGDKAKGGLRLDELASALKGGKSDGAAITPGKPDGSAVLARIRSADETEMMPPKGDRLTKEQIQTLETWISEGANWPEFPANNLTLTPLTDDLAFLRRVTIDIVGVTPSIDEVRTFLADKSPQRREKVIDKLLADPRWADNWMGYWQDVLAENPNIINPTLNNTGPFRWWIYESLLDNKPMDLFVTELVRMRGSERYGGPAGFGVASQNDVPMAQKGAIVASAFLGVQMKCARCHDAPAHRSTQKDLFQLAATLAAKPLTVPPTSSVPLDKIHTAGGRKPLIAVTLKPGSTVEPGWPFESFSPGNAGRDLAEYPDDLRDRLAAMITSPHNQRFAQVIVNRIWQRYMGRGLVEPLDDWERAKPTHPELLAWLSREFVRVGYDVKQLTRLIVTSHAYQRATERTLREPGPLYAAPGPRRLAAEQIVDSLFAATGKPFRLEEVSLDIDGRRDQNSSITLGQPRRSWMLMSTSNERDRPSLALPRIQMVADVLTAFGWRGARQDPLSLRDQSPNVLQPAIVSNGAVGTWLTRLSDDHGITPLAIESRSVDELIDTLFFRMLTRKPTNEERRAYREYLSDGFESRVRNVPASKPKRQYEPYVSWSNHLDGEATIVRQAQELAARKGEPPTERLEANWQSRLEDVLWSMVNSSEFVYCP
jgi:mono/diheme cytochrome c family protein